MTDPGCPICAGHRGEGDLVAPVVWRDDLVWVKHLVNRPMPVTLGHLLVETDRHAPFVDSLTDEEAAAVGRAVRDAARALRAELDVDAVHAMVINTRLEHFHEHVIVRHRGTPAEIPWHQVDDWSGAPRGGPAEVADLCARLARHVP
ncbi:HIT family protein [Nocardioides lijunqiniae]|uniref:HIT family protein n=1 Tax=Nocardioides lijunqiniae TaxID=2760832 RepID=UPI0030B832C8